MKKSIIAVTALAAVIATSSCKKNAENAGFQNRSTLAADYAASTLPVKSLVCGNDITTNTFFDKDTVYELCGVVTVRNNATLTIEAGTFIKSSVNQVGVQNGVLVIAKDGSINAVGNSTTPIVFTSRFLLDGIPSTHGTPGDFGGVIILGDATINVGDKLIEGLADQSKFHYGGNDNTDNRGTFQFVRIEYAGFKLADNIEVNGLTCGGVGSGTTIDHVQVSYGLDDGFEFFGGTVSPTHLVALGCDDDHFDFDNGFVGTISRGLAVIDAYSTHSGSGGSSDANGIESDNNAPAEDGTFSLTPKTHPTLNNFSIVGTRTATLTPAITAPGLRNAFRNRRGSEFTMNNSLVTGHPNGIICDVDADPTLSFLINVSAHSFGTAVSAGINQTGVVTSTSSPAQTWGMSQPWYNVASPSWSPTLPNTTRGALTNTGVGAGNWLTGWTKFDY